MPPRHPSANKPGFIMGLYRESVKNLPLLRYSWVLICTICILALTAYFKLKNSDVFYYALGVLAVSFLSFIFSTLLNIKDRFIRVLVYILLACIVSVMCSAVLGFGYFIFKNEPDFYRQWFPNLNKEKRQTSNPTDTAHNVSSTDQKIRGNIGLATSRQTVVTRQPTQSSNAKTRVEQEGPKIIQVPIKLETGESGGYQKDFTSNLGDELALAKLGKSAFDNQAYGWSIRYFQQAKVVQSSKVWMGDYPYYAGDYLHLNQNESAKAILNEMIASMGVEHTFLSHSGSIGIAISGLNEVKNTLTNDGQKSLIDEAIRKAIALKSQADK